MKKPLSPVQSMVLDFMRTFHAENDQLPPAHAISSRFGWASPANAQWHVEALRDRGVIERNAVGKYRFSREAADVR